MIAICQYLSF